MKIIQPKIECLTPLNGLEILKHLERIARTCYKSENHITEDGESAKRLIGNLIKAGHTAMIEHYSITMRYTSNVAAIKDLTRHRHTAYAVESTRYCSYDKDKFGNEIKFLEPVEIPRGTPEYLAWYEAMMHLEAIYMRMARMGAKPDQLSLLLPQSTAAEFNITANLREWRHIFELRALGHSRPCIKQIMRPTLELFHKEIPLVFDSLYDKMRSENQH